MNRPRAFSIVVLALALVPATAQAQTSAPPITPTPTPPTPPTPEPLAGNASISVARGLATKTMRYAAPFQQILVRGRVRVDGVAPRSWVERHGAGYQAELVAIERAVLDFPRGTDELRWLAETRPGYLFQRGGEPIGFAFVAKGAVGPIAALEPTDLPSILGHVEALAVAAGSDRLELEVPGVNEVAIRHLLGRGFHIDPWINLFMSNRPFGRFDRFIGFSPPIFL